MPRPQPVASSSRAAQAQRVTNPQRPAASSAPARLVAQKKRAAAEVEEDEGDEDEFGVGAGLEMSEGEEEEEEEEEDEEEEDGEDAFPEFDSELEDGVENGDDEDEHEEGDEDDDEEDSDAEVVDDEETGSESGYNSSDIERMYESPATSNENDEDEDDEEDDEGVAGESSEQRLDRLIKKYTVKPDDSIGAEGKISAAKEGGKLVPSKLVPGGYRREYDDIEAGYGSESSTEENPNTVGNIPMEWYDDMPHIGYDVNGRKIFRPAKGDELDKFLANVGDVAAWTSAEDKLLQQSVQLTDKELDIIRRLERAENPDADYDPYQPTIEWFTGEGRERLVPLSAAPEPKRRFVPSKWEHQKVMKIVKAIREGRIVPNKPSVSKPSVYAIWSEADQHTPHAMYMPAPQLPAPKTAESYNPPEEYLPTAEEKAEWEETDKEDRKTDFLPEKYAALRLVPGYKDLVQERFERCLDLYLAPRTRRVKLNIDPESLIPKLPSPKELRPFPTTQSVQYRHPGSTRVRSVSTSPSGEWLASGSEDGVVRLWDLGNGREVWRWDLKSGAVQHVSWSPNGEEAVLVALVENRVVVLSPLALVSPQVAAATLTHANTAFAASAASTKEDKNVSIKWVRPSEGDRDRGVLVYVEVPGTPTHVTWHRRGDYFATVSSEAPAVLIHLLSKHQTQSPFRKTQGTVQCVAFHPLKPWFFAATQRYVRLYDLAGQKLVRTLQTGLKWISSLDVHPAGDNLIVGSYDKKLAWFDMDLGTKPFRTLRYHARALRAVVYHPTLPLFASASDDGTIHVFHATVYADLNQNPLIVPLKILRGHVITDGLGVLDLSWHPEKPWLVSSGADGECRLWCS